MREFDWRTHTMVDGLSNPLGKQFPLEFPIGRFKRGGKMEVVVVTMPDSGLAIVGREELPVWPFNEAGVFDGYINRKLAFQDVLYRPAIKMRHVTYVLMTFNMFTGAIYFNSAVVSNSDKWGLVISRDEAILTQARMF